MGASIVPLQSTGGGGGEGQARRQPKPHFLLSLAEEQHIFFFDDPLLSADYRPLKSYFLNTKYVHFLDST